MPQADAQKAGGGGGKSIVRPSQKIKEDQLLFKNHEDLEQFLGQYVDQMQIFDPLNRKIKDEDDNQQNVTAEELIELLQEMPAIDSSHVNVPLSDEMYEQLGRQFQKEEQNCLTICSKYLQRAKDEGADFTESLMQQPDIQYLLQAMKFCADFKIMEDSIHRYEQFVQKLKKNDEKIEMFKHY